MMNKENASGALLLDAMLPHRCAVCGCRAHGATCAGCRQLLPWMGRSCTLCAAELPAVGESTAPICGRCLAHRPHYDQAVIPFKYAAPIAPLIHGLKYRNQLLHTTTLGTMLSERVRAAGDAPTVIIPMPLHRRRLQRRGFNQSLEIARRVGRELGIAVDYSLLQRIKNTASQTDLPRSRRARNVAGAFRAAPMAHARVALLDDVVTTGHTANAAARALKAAGVAHVSLWAVARV